MILANLTKAIREQNWFAVAVEFLIVIAGVVIGFQIQGWNESRAEMRQGQTNLGLLADEISQQVNEWETMLSRSEFVLNNLDDVSRAVADPQSIESDPVALPIALYFSRFHSYAPASRTIYDGLVSSGNISLIQNDEIMARVRDHYRAIQSWDQVFNLGSHLITEYHAATAGYITVEMIKADSSRDVRTDPAFASFDAVAGMQMARNLGADTQINKWLPEVYDYHDGVREVALQLKEQAEVLLLELNSASGLQTEMAQDVAP